MGLIVIDAKHRIKRSTIPGVVPEIGVSEDHTDGSWAANMIYPGELFFNIPDQRCWIGIDGDVLEIFSSTLSYPSLAFADQPITDSSRVIRLAGDTISEELVIENFSGNRVAYFAGDSSRFVMPVAFQDQVVFLNSNVYSGALNRFTTQFEVSSNGVLANDVIRITDGGGIVYGRNDRYNKAGVHAYFLGGNTSGDMRRFCNLTGNAIHDMRGDLTQTAYGTFGFNEDAIGIKNVWANNPAGYVLLGQQVGTAAKSAIYALDASRTAGNFRFLFETSATTMNASTSLAFQTSNATRMTMNATDVFTAAAHKMAVGKGSAAHSVFEVQGSVADKLQLVNANTSLGINDNTILSNSGNWTITLPTPVGIQGRKYTIIQSGAFVTSIVSVGGEKINGVGTWFLSFDGAMVTVESNGSTWTVVACKQRSTLNVIAGVTGATFQHNELLGARSISMTNRNGTISQGAFTFNAATGTITMAVTSGDKITVFYNPQ